MTMPSLSIVQQRLYNQYLMGAKFQTAAQVVDGLVAVQAQEYPTAAWALGLRMVSAVQADIDQALADGTILRTHVLRPTWHFVTPADIRWLLELSAPRIHAQNAIYYRQNELDDALFARSNDVIARALQGGNQLTKAEITALLKDEGISGDQYRIGYLITHAELDGIVCSGARRGSKFTFALLDERAPNARKLARDEALDELTGRYFATRSPATVQDFAWWSGLTVADARAGIEMVRPQLTREIIDGTEYWLTDSPVQVENISPVVHLLPVYDEFIVAYTDRSAAYNDVSTLRDNIVFYYAIVLDGCVVGTWKRAIKKQVVEIETTLFEALTDGEHEALDAAAQQYGDFVGLPVEMNARR
jgi:hypothetical protein